MRFVPMVRVRPAPLRAPLVSRCVVLAVAVGLSVCPDIVLAQSLADARYLAPQKPSSPHVNNSLSGFSYNDVSQSALGGDPVAQVELARMLLEGRGVPKNPANAFEWMQRAAQSGYIPAMRALAQLYFKGIGTKVDDRQGLFWLLQAADDKDPESAYVLAAEWERVSGDAINNPDAFAFYRAAAQGGNAPAQARLGSIFEHGLHGVKADAESAAQWYEKAALQGNVSAARALAALYDRGVGVKVDARRAAQFYARAAALGDAESLNVLGERFAAGRGVTKNLTLAVALFSMSIDADEEGSPPAAANRRKYFSSLSVEQQQQVKKWINVLSEPDALLELVTAK